MSGSTRLKVSSPRVLVLIIVFQIIARVLLVFRPHLQQNPILHLELSLQYYSPMTPSGFFHPSQLGKRLSVAACSDNMSTSRNRTRKDHAVELQEQVICSAAPELLPCIQNGAGRPQPTLARVHKFSSFIPTCSPFEHPFSRLLPTFPLVELYDMFEGVVSVTELLDNISDFKSETREVFDKIEGYQKLPDESRSCCMSRPEKKLLVMLNKEIAAVIRDDIIRLATTLRSSVTRKWLPFESRNASSSCLAIACSGPGQGQR